MSEQWKMVPDYPTREMIDAAQSVPRQHFETVDGERVQISERYRAMLAAAPVAPQSLEEKLISAGLGYPLSKEDAVKIYKASLAPRTDHPSNEDCDYCAGVGHDYYGDPCIGCCKPGATQDSQPVGFRYRCSGDWELMEESPYADGRISYCENGEELQPLYTRPDSGEVDRLRKDLIASQATIANQAKMIEHLRGGLTGYTAVDMTTAAAQGFRDGVASVVVELPPQYPVPDEPDEAIDDSYMDAYHAAKGMRHSCEKAIIAAGGRIKE